MSKVPGVRETEVVIEAGHVVATLVSTYNARILYDEYCFLYHPRLYLPSLYLPILYLSSLDLPISLALQSASTSFSTNLALSQCITWLNSITVCIPLTVDNVKESMLERHGERQRKMRWRRTFTKETRRPLEMDRWTSAITDSACDRLHGTVLG